MLSRSTLLFLKNLKVNNNKAWMDTHRVAYLSAKDDFESFTEALLHEMAKIDASLGSLTVKDCTFRINRDIRFSQNKDPYKTNMACYMAKGGKKSVYAGYYCHVEPGSSFIAGGIWMPEPNALKKIRQEIDYNFSELNKILSGKSFTANFGALQKTEGMVLSRPPKGYEADNPAIEYIKLKSFIASLPLEDAMLTEKGLVKHLSKLFSQLKPLIDFLNIAVDGDE